MPQILRTVLIPDEDQLADGTPSFDLPVNPLSVVLLTVQAENATADLDDYSSLQQLLAMVTNARVTYRGASIINGSLTDLAMLYGALAGWPTIQGAQGSVNGGVRAITVPLCFGRYPYDPRECFPATRRGDLVMTLSTDIALAGLENLSLQAETIELLDAAPERFCKVTTTSKVHDAVSEHDIELPIGNDLLGMLLFSPVVPAAGLRTASFGSLALEVDNVETIFAEARWESMRADLARRRKQMHGEDVHFHSFQYDPTGVAVTEAATREPERIFTWLDNYAYLDLDPLMDGAYALKTAGAARVNLRVDTQVASATGMRVLPVELVQIAGAGGVPAA